MGPLWRKISEPLRGGSFGYFYSGLHGHTCRGHRGHYERGVLGHHTRGQDSHWSGRHKGHSVQPFRQRPGLPGRRQTTVGSSSPMPVSDNCVLPTLVSWTRSSFGDRTFAVAGPQVWNSLPPNLIWPVQAVTEEIFILTVRPRPTVKCF